MTEPTKKNACRRCGGETAKGSLKSGNQEATIVIAGKADDFLGVIPYKTSQISARVCTHCGQIEFFARNVQDLLQINGDD